MALDPADLRAIIAYAASNDLEENFTITPDRACRVLTQCKIGVDRYRNRDGNPFNRFQRRTFKDVCEDVSRICPHYTEAKTRFKDLILAITSHTLPWLKSILFSILIVAGLWLSIQCFRWVLGKMGNMVGGQQQQQPAGEETDPVDTNPTKSSSGASTYDGTTAVDSESNFDNDAPDKRSHISDGPALQKKPYMNTRTSTKPLRCTPRRSMRHERCSATSEKRL